MGIDLVEILILLMPIGIVNRLTMLADEVRMNYRLHNSFVECTLSINNSLCRLIGA